MYPSEASFEQLARMVSFKDQSQTLEPNTRDIASLEEIISKDPLSDISEQEKELLWRLR
jgi:hypothetical protein